jgi:hypothetical protein
VRSVRVASRTLFSAGALLAALLRPFPAIAQDAPFVDLHRTLEQGDRVIVTDAGGHDWKGRLAAIRPDVIVLTNGDRRAFRGPDVRRIRRMDGVWNGVLIGAAIGVGGIPIWQRASCGSNDSECATIVGAVGLVTLVPGGAVLGLVVDKLVMRTVYQAPGHMPVVMIAPVVGTEAVGLSVRVTF